MKKNLWILLLISCTRYIDAQKIPPHIRIILEAGSRIEQNYYDTTFNDKNWSAIKQEAYSAAVSNLKEAHHIIRKMLSALDDPAIRFLTPVDFLQFQREVNDKQHIGIGLAELFSYDIDPTTREVIVITPIPQSPAAEILRPKDVITAINGETLKGLPLQEIAQKMRLPEGQTIHLEIERKGKRLQERLVTQTIQQHQIPSYKILTYKGKKLGCIWFPQFSQASAARFLGIIREFQAAEVEGLLLDLRSNPGGLVQEVQRIAGYCIGNKVLAHTDSQSPIMQHLMGMEKKQMKDWPMVILINGGTASASELLAGTLQYHQRATLVGEKSIGKGLIHTFQPLVDGSSLVISMGRLRLPNGRDILTQAIEPDIAIKNKKPFHFGYQGKDKQFKKGLKLLAKKIKKYQSP